MTVDEHYYIYYADNWPMVGILCDFNNTQLFVTRLVRPHKSGFLPIAITKNIAVGRMIYCNTTYAYDLHLERLKRIG